MTLKRCKNITKSINFSQISFTNEHVGFIIILKWFGFHKSELRTKTDLKSALKYGPTITIHLVKMNKVKDISNCTIAFFDKLIN